MKQPWNQKKSPTPSELTLFHKKSNWSWPNLKHLICLAAGSLRSRLWRVSDRDTARTHDFPPKMAPRKVMQVTKGKTSHRLLEEDCRRLRKEFWGKHLRARGYFVATGGTVTDEVVAEYIYVQDAEPEDDGFKTPQ